MRNVAIFIFDDVEVMDFTGPFEIFSVTGLRSGGEKPFNVFTVAEKHDITARGNLKITASYLLADCPQPDIVLVPGGGGIHADGTHFGSRKQMHNPVLLNWLKEQNKTAELLLSVCTGSLILGKAGLLKGLAATTHWKAIDAMKDAAPHTKLLPEERWVDNGRIILSAGVSAGIDMALYVVGKLLGKPAADETAQYIQYQYWKQG
jgi:transcriptional regulator GlxA family with amidase domain